MNHDPRDRRCPSLRPENAGQALTKAFRRFCLHRNSWTCEVIAAGDFQNRLERESRQFEFSASALFHCINLTLSTMIQIAASESRPRPSLVRPSPRCTL
jgi:hypothetical protein